MKYSLSILSFLILSLFLVTECSSLKKNNYLAINTQPVVPVIKDTIQPLKPLEKREFFLDSDDETKWVDSVYNQMSFNEKVGQLFMVAAYSNKNEEHFQSIDKLIKDYKIGGLIFFQGGPMRQAKLTNRFQANSKIPLFLGIDAEWGLSMRLDSTYRYPWNMTLGAIRDMKLIEKVGEQMGKETKRLGLQFNFAPVIDINTNPKNPIIGNRSFGEDKKNVTERATALMYGVQSQGVFSTGKHFPGHGDTETDSHLTLPKVSFTKERIEDVELYPYKQMFKNGLASVMVAHLNIPSLEPRENYPTSLSYNVVTNILQKELGFKGLIFTDALNMKGASNFKKPGDIDLAAFLAGNDILLFSENVPIAVSKITDAYKAGTITDTRLAKSVKKILHYKYKAGLNNYKPIDMQNLVSDLNPPTDDALQYELYENAITVIKREKEQLPIKDLEKKIAYVKIGDDTNDTFLNTLNKYTQVTEVVSDNIDTLNAKLSKFDLVIIGFHKTDKAWKSHELTDAEVVKITAIASKNKVILDSFTKPYTLSKIPSLDAFENVIISYQNCDIAQEVSAELIFGAIGSKGKLPVSINDNFKVNYGIPTEKLNRLGFANPEFVDMSSAKLAEIETIANKAMMGKMAPGMQILVARKGKVIYQKSFGYQTYENKIPVKNTDLYDIASVSKMVSTLPNVMQLFDKKGVTLDTRLGDMVPIFKATDKDSITFKELLSHYARLQAWIPFYKETLDSLKYPSAKYYQKEYSADFSKKVAESLYIRNDFHDTIMKKIAESTLLTKKEYKYSDFTFIILKEFLERVTAKKLDELSSTNFFNPLGMNYTMYNPLQKFSPNVIAPTEIDNYFRHMLLQGYVHDMEAAMEGGVAGHAGVFSNSLDVAKMMQLFLQKGSYGGKEYFTPETFDIFNTCYFCQDGNRRGLGFDKPQLGNSGPTCGCVSKASFGHTGFTGTMAWADPDSELIFVFLSNRTYPDSNASNKLAKENIREDIQKIIQDAILDKKEL